MCCCSEGGQPCPELHQSKDMIVHLCSALARTHLECWAQVWVSQLQKRHRYTGGKGQKNNQGIGIFVTQGESQRAGVVQLRGEKAWGNLIKVYKCLTEGSKEDGAGHFSAVCCNVTRGNGHKPKHRKFHLNITFLPVGLVKLQKYLKVLETCLDKAWSNCPS